ncbi:MAG: iron hydrogenase small subunit [Spirochaetes bacterium]|nr:iron hydrogenase small subunit [Spirochaetota bacterium]
MAKIQINDKKIEVKDGLTILESADIAGINIPTLCHVKGGKPRGACRVCVVEVEGARNLQASCSTPIKDGMVIKTNTRRVRKARQTVVELILSEHDGDCKTCDRNNDCELQELARELSISNIRYEGSKTKRRIDDSTPALIRDSGKCIKCGRCVTVCSEIQSVGSIFQQHRGFATVVGPAFDKNLEDVVCVQCGQCAAICPVGAIIEKTHIDYVWDALDNPKKYVVVQTAPAIRAALGECFGNPPGTLVTGKMTTALRLLGFDSIFDTNFAADLTIMEEGTELLTRLKKAIVDKKNVALPMFTSCSPAWIKFAEHFYPDMLDNISTCKSPQQMFGAVAKTYFAKKINKDPKDIVVVSVMPCTAKKYEAQRPEMNDSGEKDVDYVLTTRELAKMIKQAGIDFNILSDSEMDSPLGLSSGAADIFANTGGVMEAAVRTAYEIVTGKPLPLNNLHIEPIAGLQGVKKASLKIEETLSEWSFLKGVELKVAVAHGLGNARKILDAIKENKENFHFVEIMSCPGGCIGGGGQPRFTTDDVRLKRIQAIYKEDEGKKLRKSHENPDIIKLYEEFLGKPLGEKSHHLLHTEYTQRCKA